MAVLCLQFIRLNINNVFECSCTLNNCFVRVSKEVCKSKGMYNNKYGVYCCEANSGCMVQTVYIKKYIIYISDKLC